MLTFHINFFSSPSVRSSLLFFFRRQKVIKMNGTERIKEMLLSRLCAAYATQEKTKAAQKLPKCFHVSSAAKDTIDTV
jgi:hypothetical protein